MKTTDFHFELPQSQIAQTPLEDRSSSRLLMLDRDSGETRHGFFRDIVNELNAGDCIVLNETKVIPARLRGRRKTGAQVELLLLRRLDANRWEALAGPGRKARPGDEIIFGEVSGDTGAGVLKAVVESIIGDGDSGGTGTSGGDGRRIVKFEYEGVFEERLNELGEMPLPPYIKEKLSDGTRYQTVYARNDGSAAAPTAGLHFTEELLEMLSAKGVQIARITLHVGIGTFRPVVVNDVSEHVMHSEFYNIDSSQAKLINDTRRSGGRIIAVGTTSCRTLEACADENGCLIPGSGWTNIFIYPGYKFKLIDGLITNFHLPGSTLIMLVSALAGREHVLTAYCEAVEMGYRFYSFGDCMMVV